MQITLSTPLRRRSLHDLARIDDCRVCFVYGPDPNIEVGLAS